jgi:hypothetical protein
VAGVTVVLKNDEQSVAPRVVAVALTARRQLSALQTASAAETP